MILDSAFADPSLRGIVASIGGDDCVRVLPHVNATAELRDPKLVMGYSDTTTLLAWLNTLGLVTFHGPAVMAGLAQARQLPRAFLAHLRALLFEAPARFTYCPYEWHAEGYPDWSDPAQAGRVNEPRPSPGWRFLQGGVAEGRLFGGCVEVLEFLKGTRFWPAAEFWDEDRILFLETSEEKPAPEQVMRMLRNYGTQGILGRLRGLLIGRPRGYTGAQVERLDRLVLKVARDEFSRPDLAVVSGVDFGHTDPQLVLPLGVRARIDVERREVGLLEPPLA